jgi:DNA repair protein RAD5
VLTSYGVLGTEYKEHERHKNKKRKVVKFFDKQWHRVIMDEAHNLRNTKTNMFKAAMGLSGSHKWALSGTPVQNNTDDVFALFSFLNVEPFNDKRVFTQQVSRPVKAGDITALTKLKTVLGASLLRRTKDTMMAELELPPKRIEIVRLEFPEGAQKVYTTLHTAAKLVFDQLLEHDAVLSNYSAVLEVLLRLRQCCASERLLPPERIAAAEAVLSQLQGTSGRKGVGRGGKSDGGPMKALSREEAEHLLAQLKKSMSTSAEDDGSSANKEEAADAAGMVECTICLSDTGVDDARIIRLCSHVFCCTCMDAWKAARRDSTTCPLCRQEYGQRDLVDYSTLATTVAMPVWPSEGASGSSSSAKQVPESVFDLDSANSNGSVKLDYLLQSLGETPAGEKSVVFSSFTTYVSC